MEKASGGSDELMDESRLENAVLATQPYFVPGLATSAVRAAIEHADEVERRTGWVPQRPVPYMVRLLVTRDPAALRAQHPKYKHSLGLSEARLYSSLRPPTSYPVGLLVALVERERALALLRRTSVERVRAAKRRELRRLNNDWTRARQILKQVSWGPAPEDVHSELGAQGRAAMGAPWMSKKEGASANGSAGGVGASGGASGGRFSRLDKWSGPPEDEPAERLLAAADPRVGASGTFALAPESAASTSLGALRAHLDRRLGLKARRNSAIETDAKVLAQAAAMGLLSGGAETAQAGHGTTSGTAVGPGASQIRAEGEEQESKLEGTTAGRRPYIRRRGSTAVPDVQTALRLRALVATDVPSSDLALGVRGGQAQASRGRALPDTPPAESKHAAGSYEGLAAGRRIAAGSALSTARSDRQSDAGDAASSTQRTAEPPTPSGKPDVTTAGDRSDRDAEMARDLSTVADALLPPSIDLGLRGPLWQDCLYQDYAHRFPLQRLDFQGMAPYLTDPLLTRMLRQRGVLASLRALLLPGCRKVTEAALLPAVFAAQQLVELDVRRCDGLGAGFFLGLLGDAPPPAAGTVRPGGVAGSGARRAVGQGSGARRSKGRLAPIAERSSSSRRGGSSSAREESKAADAAGDTGRRPIRSLPRDRLRVLRAGGCTAMDGLVAVQVCGGLCALESIDLTRCLRISDKVLDALAGRPGAMGGVGEGVGGRSAAGWGQIEEVWLDHCKDFSEEGFMALASHAGSLKRLSLAGCRQLGGAAFAGLPAPVVRRRRVCVVSARTLRREGIMLDEDPARNHGDDDGAASGNIGGLVGEPGALPSSSDRPVVVALARHDPSQARQQDEQPAEGKIEPPNMLVARLMRATGLETDFPERIRDDHAQALLLANRLGFDQEAKDAAEEVDAVIEEALELQQRLGNDPSRHAASGIRRQLDPLQEQDDEMLLMLANSVNPQVERHLVATGASGGVGQHSAFGKAGGGRKRAMARRARRRSVTIGAPVLETRGDLSLAVVLWRRRHAVRRSGIDRMKPSHGTIKQREAASRRAGEGDAAAAGAAVSKGGSLAQMEARAAVGNAKGLGRRDADTGKPVESQYVHVEGKLGVNPDHDVIGGGGLDASGRGHDGGDGGGLTLAEKVSRNRRGSLAGIDLSGTQAIEAAAAKALAGSAAVTADSGDERPTVSRSSHRSGASTDARRQAKAAAIARQRETVIFLAAAALRKGRRLDWAQSLESRCALERLDLTKCALVDDEGLEFIARACGKLKVVVLSRCGRVGARGLSALLAGCQDLEELDLTDCVQIDDGALQVAVSSSAAGGASLLLQGSTSAGGLTAAQQLQKDSVDEGLQKVARELATPAAQARKAAEAMARSRKRENALVQLALTAGTEAPGRYALGSKPDKFEPDGGEDQTWLQAVRQPVPMKILRLTGCHKISDAGVDTVASRFGRTLQELSLQGLYRVTDAGLASIARECYGLKVLRVGGRLNLQVTAMMRDESRGQDEGRSAALGGGSKYVMAVRAMDGGGDEPGSGDDDNGDQSGSTAGQKAALPSIGSASQKVAPERRQHTFFGQPKITGVGLGLLFGSLAIRASLEVLDLSRCVTLDSRDIQAMLPAPPRNWKDAYLRRQARLERKERERAKRWRKPRRPGTELASASATPGQHVSPMQLFEPSTSPFVKPVRAYSDAGGRALVRRPRLLSDPSSAESALVGPASPSSGTAATFAWGGSQRNLLGFADYDAPEDEHASSARGYKLPETQEHLKTTASRRPRLEQDRRRMSTPVATSPHIAPARSRAISFDPATGGGLSGGAMDFMLPSRDKVPGDLLQLPAGSRVEDSQGLALQMGNETAVVTFRPNDPIGKLHARAHFAMSTFDQQGHFTVPPADGGGTGLKGLSVKTQLDLLQKRTQRVKWGGAMGSTNAPAMMMRRQHFGKRETWKTKAARRLGAGGLTLLELEEHPSKVYKGYFDLRRNSGGEVQRNLLMPAGLPDDGNGDAGGAGKRRGSAPVAAFDDLDDLESVASTISSMSGASAGSEEFDVELRTEPFALRELVMPGVQLDDDGALWVARWLEWQHHLANEPTDTAAERKRQAARLPPSAVLAPVMPNEDSSRPGLRKLYLAKCRRLTDVGVAALSLMLPHVTHVQLDSCPRLTSFAITALARRCSELKWLSIKGCELVDGRSLLSLSRMCPFMERVQVSRCPGIKQAVLLETASALHRVWMGLESSLEVLHAPARVDRIGSQSSTSTEVTERGGMARRPNGTGLSRADETQSVGSADSIQVVADVSSEEEGDDGLAQASLRTEGSRHVESVHQSIHGNVPGQIPGSSGVIQKYEAWVEKQTVRKGKTVSGVHLHQGAKNMDRSRRKREEGLHWTGQGMVRSASATGLLGVQRDGTAKKRQRPLPALEAPSPASTALSRRSSAASARGKQKKITHRVPRSGSVASASSVSTFEVAGFGAGSPELLIITPDKGLRGCPPIAMRCFRQRAIEQRSAIVLQRALRAYHIRCMCLRAQRAVETARRERVYRAAIGVQMLWRARVARQTYHSLHMDWLGRVTRETKWAARLIQRMERGRQARAATRQLRLARRLRLLHVWRQFKRRYNHFVLKKPLRATQDIQRVWRGHLGRQEYQRQITATLSAVRRLVRWYLHTQAMDRIHGRPAPREQARQNLLLHAKPYPWATAEERKAARRRRRRLGAGPAQSKSCFRCVYPGEPPVKRGYEWADVMRQALAQARSGMPVAELAVGLRARVQCRLMVVAWAQARIRGWLYGRKPYQALLLARKDAAVVIQRKWRWERARVSFATCKRRLIRAADHLQAAARGQLQRRRFVRHFIVYRYLETPPMLFLPDVPTVDDVAAYVYHRREDPRAKANVQRLLGPGVEVVQPPPRQEAFAVRHATNVALVQMRARHVYRHRPLIEGVLRMRHSNGKEALKIVRCYRRYRFRALLQDRIFQRQLDQMRRRVGATKFQRQWRAHVERRIVFELRKQLNAARAIQKIIRGMLARMLAKQLKQQARVRRAKKRAALQNSRDVRDEEGAAVAASGAGAPEESGWKQPFVGRNNFVRWLLQTQAIGAAIALQQWWRRTIGPHLQLWRWKRTKNKAATKLQRFSRARAWRRWFQEVRQRRTRAASAIQRSFKKFQARQMWQRALRQRAILRTHAAARAKAVHRVTMLLADRMAWEDEKEQKAALLLQRKYRRLRQLRMAATWRSRQRLLDNAGKYTGQARLLLSILEAQMTVVPYVSSSIYLPSSRNSIVKRISRKLGFNLFEAVKEEILGTDATEAAADDGAMMVDDRKPATTKASNLDLQEVRSARSGSKRPDSRASSTMDLALQSISKPRGIDAIIAQTGSHATPRLAGLAPASTSDSGGLGGFVRRMKVKRGSTTARSSGSHRRIPTRSEVMRALHRASSGRSGTMVAVRSARPSDSDDDSDSKDDESMQELALDSAEPDDAQGRPPTHLSSPLHDATGVAMVPFVGDRPSSAGSDSLGGRHPTEGMSSGSPRQPTSGRSPVLGVAASGGGRGRRAVARLGASPSPGPSVTTPGEGQGQTQPPFVLPRLALTDGAGKSPIRPAASSIGTSKEAPGSSTPISQGAGARAGSSRHIRPGSAPASPQAAHLQHSGFFASARLSDDGEETLEEGDGTSQYRGTLAEIENGGEGAGAPVQAQGVSGYVGGSPLSGAEGGRNRHMPGVDGFIIHGTPTRSSRGLDGFDPAHGGGKGSGSASGAATPDISSPMTLEERLSSGVAARKKRISQAHAARLARYQSRVSLGEPSIDSISSQALDDDRILDSILKRGLRRLRASNDDLAIAGEAEARAVEISARLAEKERKDFGGWAEFCAAAVYVLQEAARTTSGFSVGDMQLTLACDEAAWLQYQVAFRSENLLEAACAFDFGLLIGNDDVLLAQSIQLRQRARVRAARRARASGEMPRVVQAMASGVRGSKKGGATAKALALSKSSGLKYGASVSGGDRDEDHFDDPATQRRFAAVLAKRLRLDRLTKNFEGKEELLKRLKRQEDEMRDRRAFGGKRDGGMSVVVSSAKLRLAQVKLGLEDDRRVRGRPGRFGMRGWEWTLTTARPDAGELTDVDVRLRQAIAALEDARVVGLHHHAAMLRELRRLRRERAQMRGEMAKAQLVDAQREQGIGFFRSAADEVSGELADAELTVRRLRGEAGRQERSMLKFVRELMRHADEEGGMVSGDWLQAACDILAMGVGIEVKRGRKRKMIV